MCKSVSVLRLFAYRLRPLRILPVVRVHTRLEVLFLPTVETFKEQSVTMVLTSWKGSLLLCRTSFNLPRTKFPFHVLLVKFGSCFVLNLNRQEIEFKIMLRIYFLQFSYLTVASYA
jgi:hypothetical protein